MTQEQALTQKHGRPGVGDPLVARLLPVLMHRLNNATQLMSNLHAMGQYEPETDWLKSHCDDLAECSVGIEQAGYLLAVLASSSGANLLLERREERGVEIMVRAVLEAVRRDGGQIQGTPRELPNQSPQVHNGWELPWAFGSLLYQSTCGPETEGVPLDWQLLREESTWVLVCSLVPDDHFESLQPLLAARLPETQLDVCTQGWSWRLPADWLCPTDSQSPGGAA